MSVRPSVRARRAIARASFRWRSAGEVPEKYAGPPAGGGRRTGPGQLLADRGPSVARGQDERACVPCATTACQNFQPIVVEAGRSYRDRIDVTAFAVAVSNAPVTLRP